MVAKEVCNDEIKGQPSKEFIRIQCVIKAGVLGEFPYLGTIKYTWLKFLHAFPLKLLMEESKSSTFSIQCFYKALNEIKLDQVISCSVLPEGETERCVTRF